MKTTTILLLIFSILSCSKEEIQVPKQNDTVIIRTDTVKVVSIVKTDTVKQKDTANVVIAKDTVKIKQKTPYEILLDTIRKSPAEFYFGCIYQLTFIGDSCLIKDNAKRKKTVVCEITGDTTNFTFKLQIFSSGITTFRNCKFNPKRDIVGYYDNGVNPLKAIQMDRFPKEIIK